MNRKVITNKIFGILVMLLTGLSSSNAQIVDNTDGKAFMEAPFFNSEFIKSNYIRSISGRVLEYKLGNKIREPEETRQYLFNSEGLLIERLDQKKTPNDSTFLSIQYFYDKRGNIIKVRKISNLEYSVETCEFDDNKREIVKEVRRLDTILSPDNSLFNNFEIDEKYIQVKESSTYQEYPGQQKRIIYNEEGRPYKEEFTYFDSLNRPIKIVKQLVRIPNRNETFYKYNDFGDLHVILFSSVLYDNTHRKTIFNYDEKQRLIERLEYKNGELITRYKIIYKQDSDLFSDILVQDLPTNFIKIYELREYTFFE